MSVGVSIEKARRFKPAGLSHALPFSGSFEADDQSTAQSVGGLVKLVKLRAVTRVQDSSDLDLVTVQLACEIGLLQARGLPGSIHGRLGCEDGGQCDCMLAVPDCAGSGKVAIVFHTANDGDLDCIASEGESFLECGPGGHHFRKIPNADNEVVIDLRNLRAEYKWGHACIAPQLNGSTRIIVDQAGRSCLSGNTRRLEVGGVDRELFQEALNSSGVEFHLEGRDLVTDFDPVVRTVSLLFVDREGDLSLSTIAPKGPNQLISVHLFSPVSMERISNIYVRPSRGIEQFCSEIPKAFEVGACAGDLGATHGAWSALMWHCGCGEVSP